jgi:threonine dehydrogenase-like Zn-dependent dehydrogenase
MKAIVNTGPNKVEWLDWPMPEPKAGQVRIRTGACGICATDLEMIGGWGRTPIPMVPGHEWAGYVDAVGPGGDASLIGKKCVAENVLSDGLEVGFHYPGGYGQYFLTEAKNVYPLPADFPLAHAALIEPLAVCVRGWNRLKPDDTRSALVMGDGPIGLLMLLVLKAKGIGRVALVGGLAGRLKLAKSLGAAAVLDFHEVKENFVKGVIDRLGGPFVNVIECTGSGLGIDSSWELAAHGGKVLVIGEYMEHRASFVWTELQHKELEIISTVASAGGWAEAVRLAASGAVPLGKLVTHRIPAEKFAEGIAMTRSKAGDLVKVVMEWDGE